MGDDVLQTVDPPVARPVRQHQRPRIQHVDKPRRIPTRTRIDIPLPIRGRQHRERRQRDERPAMRIEMVKLLQHRALAGGPEMRAQGGSVGDLVHVV